MLFRMLNSFNSNAILSVAKASLKREAFAHLKNTTFIEMRKFLCVLLWDISEAGLQKKNLR